MTHIDTAVAEGPKAGMRQYLSKLATYGPNTPQARLLSEFLALGKGLSKSQAEKVIFQAYCERFTEEITQGQSAQSVEDNDLLTFLTGTNDTPEQDDDDSVGVIVEANGGSGTVADKLARTIRRGRRPKNANRVPEVGDTFTYHGANGDSVHTVVGEGKTKRHQKPGLVCRNANGKDRVWNLNTLAIYAEQGKLSVA